MTQEKDPCQFTARAVAVATCAQSLTGRGYTIVGIILNEKSSIIFIESAAHNKNLKPISCGCTWNKGALHVVYQADVKGVLVKWLEPVHVHQQPQQAVH